MWFKLPFSEVKKETSGINGLKQCDTLNELQGKEKI